MRGLSAGLLVITSVAMPLSSHDKVGVLYAGASVSDTARNEEPAFVQENSGMAGAWSADLTKGMEVSSMLGSVEALTSGDLFKVYESIINKTSVNKGHIHLSDKIKEAIADEDTKQDFELEKLEFPKNKDVERLIYEEFVGKKLRSVSNLATSLNATNVTDASLLTAKDSVKDELVGANKDLKDLKQKQSEETDTTLEKEKAATTEAVKEAEAKKAHCDKKWRVMSAVYHFLRSDGGAYGSSPSDWVANLDNLKHFIGAPTTSDQVLLDEAQDNFIHKVHSIRSTRRNFDSLLTTLKKGDDNFLFDLGRFLMFESLPGTYRNINVAQSLTGTQSMKRTQWMRIETTAKYILEWMFNQGEDAYGHAMGLALGHFHNLIRENLEEKFKKDVSGCPFHNQSPIGSDAILWTAMAFALGPAPVLGKQGADETQWDQWVSGWSLLADLLGAANGPQTASEALTTINAMVAANHVAGEDNTDVNRLLVDFAIPFVTRVGLRLKASKSLSSDLNTNKATIGTYYKNTNAIKQLYDTTSTTTTVDPVLDPNKAIDELDGLQLEEDLLEAAQPDAGLREDVHDEEIHGKSNTELDLLPKEESGSLKPKGGCTQLSSAGKDSCVYNGCTWCGGNGALWAKCRFEPISSTCDKPMADNPMYAKEECIV